MLFKSLHYSVEFKILEFSRKAAAKGCKLEFDPLLLVFIGMFYIDNLR